MLHDISGRPETASFPSVVQVFPVPVPLPVPLPVPFTTGTASHGASFSPSLQEKPTADEEELRKGLTDKSSPSSGGCGHGGHGAPMNLFKCYDRQQEVVTTTTRKNVKEEEIISTGSDRRLLPANSQLNPEVKDDLVEESRSKNFHSSDRNEIFRVAQGREPQPPLRLRLYNDLRTGLNILSNPVIGWKSNSSVAMTANDGHRLSEATVAIGNGGEEEEEEEEEERLRLAAEDDHGYMNLRQKSKRKFSGDRSRPKRQAARDMCRPLKTWLYEHRDLPYPNKTEKQELAVSSKMTITQVSNWFANARRRLKNTVNGGPEITWAKRIKLYNSCVVGNQELLSVSSDETAWDEMDETGSTSDGERPDPADNSRPLRNRLYDVTKDRSTIDDDVTSGGSSSGKFKQGLLQRYLTDAYELGLFVGQEEDDRAAGDRDDGATKQRHGNPPPGSLSSYDYEEMSLSSRSTPTAELQATEDSEEMIPYKGRYATNKRSGGVDLDDLNWKEISAALALTNLARSRLHSVSSQTSSTI